MMYSLTWLADVLRTARLTVVEELGWQSFGHGDVGQIKGVICHHTAGPKIGDHPSLWVVKDGRPGLRGPLAQLFLARSGTYHVISAGKAWHAGSGSWQGVKTGNTSFIGIEAENTGQADDMPWPTLQMHAYAQGVAAILAHIKAPAIWCCGHKEYATPKGRKIDPTFNMDDFRLEVMAILQHNNVTEKEYEVKPGDTLWAISRSQGMKLDQLLALNHLTLASVIRPGDRLSVL